MTFYNILSIYGMVKYGKSSNNEVMPSRYQQKNEYQKEREQLGQTIKKLRNERKMTQEDLAEYADINVSYLAKIENGYVNTSIRYLIKISRGLKAKVRELFEF
jgi:DNA-binding XRE family transcriptional regulator